MIIVLGTLIAVTCGSVSSTWHGPVNTCAVAGGRVVMTCQTPASSNSTSWYYTAFGSTNKLLVSDGDRVSNGFKEFQVSGDVPGEILTLDVVRMKDAGLYSCSAVMKVINKTARLEELTALLIVLESAPVCTLKSSQVRVGVNIEMVCTVNFTGPFPPTMEWKQHGTKDDSDGGIRDGHINTVVIQNKVKSTARIAADSSRNNSTYTCRTYFALPSTSLNVNATNAPDYNYTWTSQSVQVVYNRCINTATNLWIIIAVVFVCVIIIIAFSVHVVCIKRRSGALTSLNGQTRPRNDATVALAANNNEPIYSEYTEIPSYNVCREAMDRCHNSRPVSNVGYLPMERKSNTSIRGAVPEAPGKARASACTKSTHQNNEYMTTDDDVLGPGYDVSASSSTELQPIVDETASTYLNLSKRKTASSTDYAVLASACEQQQLLLEEELQPKEPKTTGEKTEEQNDYLLPLPD